jgi:ABC-type transport system involved in Fe-S cluster assembly fused permease/ATPase subunit
MTMNMNMIRSLSNKLFEHVHELDLSFHRAGTRGSLYAISRSIRNLESGLRFLLSNLTPTVVELGMLGTMLAIYCGPKYSLNIFITVSLYTWFTRWYAQVYGCTCG